MVFELTENFIPYSFPHREEQFQEILEVFENFEKHGYGGNNLLLYGSSGAGKSSVIKRIMEQKPNLFLFVSGAECNSTHKVIGKLAHMETTPRSTSEVFNWLVEKLRKEKKIIIIDEINKVKDVDILINFINELFRKTTIPIIFITNQFTFIQNMPKDAQLTLFFKRIEFENYNAFQLGDILKSRFDAYKKRAKLIFNGNSEACMNYIAAKIVNECDSSARIALDMLLKCVMKNDYSQTFVNKYVYNLQEQSWQNFVHGLNKTEKRFLQAMIEITTQKETVTSSDIHEEMKDVQLTPARISQLITLFIEDYDILSAEYENAGRGHGRYRIIKFKSPEVRNTIIQHAVPMYQGEPAPGWYSEAQERDKEIEKERIAEQIKTAENKSEKQVTLHNDGN